jgi:hypothetical protein
LENNVLHTAKKHTLTTSTSVNGFILCDKSLLTSYEAFVITSIWFITENSILCSDEIEFLVVSLLLLSIEISLVIDCGNLAV